MNHFIKFLKEKRIEFHLDSQVKKYTTIRVGGEVASIVIAKTCPQLFAVLTYLHDSRLPFVLLGGGSNVVFADDSPRLNVIVNKTQSICKVDDHTILADSGITIKKLLSWCSNNEVGGLEFLAGIPGTLGGAAAVNAGAFGQSIDSVLEQADIIDESGKSRTVGRDYFKFSYRESVFKYGKEVILQVYLRFTPSKHDKIQEEVQRILKYRKERHPSRKQYTAGCFFKNPVIDDRKTSAGKLIEQAGLKGSEYKNLYISPQHGNFLVNRGEAAFSDLERFAGEIRDKVRQEQGILLEREVIFISPEGEKY